jgi:hypothetical protein
MLAYLAAIDPSASTGGRLVIGGVLVKEPDLNQLQASAGPVGDMDPPAALELLGAESVQPFALVCDPDIAAADCERCFSGVYRRLRVMMGDPESPKQSQPWLFITLSSSASTYARGAVGLTQAANASGAGKYVFVDRSPSPARIGGILAAAVAGRVVSGFPDVPAVIAQLLAPEGKAVALLHYTLREECVCFACRLVREAVYPPKPVANLTVNSPSLLALRLPQTIFHVLWKAGIRTVGQLQAASDRDLSRLRNIGKGQVGFIRSEVERYLAGR